MHHKIILRRLFARGTRRVWKKKNKSYRRQSVATLHVSSSMFVASDGSLRNSRSFLISI